MRITEKMLWLCGKICCNFCMDLHGFTLKVNRVVDE